MLGLLQDLKRKKQENLSRAMDMERADQEAAQKQQDAPIVYKLAQQIISGGGSKEELQKLGEGIDPRLFVKAFELALPSFKNRKKAEKTDEEKIAFEEEKKRRLGQVGLEGDIAKAESVRLQEAVRGNKAKDDASALNTKTQYWRMIAKKYGITEKELKTKLGFRDNMDPIEAMLAKEFGTPAEGTSTLLQGGGADATITPSPDKTKQIEDPILKGAPPAKGNEKETLVVNGREFKVVGGKWVEVKK